VPNAQEVHLKEVHLIYISAAFFLSAFISHLQCSPDANPFRRRYAFNLIPFLIVMASMYLPIYVSSIILYKHALLAMLLGQIYTLFLYKTMSYEFGALIAFGLSALLLVLSFFGWILPTLFLNIGLIASTLLLGLHDASVHRSTDDRQIREYTEIQLIAILGLLIMSAGNQYYILFSGQVIFLFYQLAEAVLFSRFLFFQRLRTAKRIDDLETRFERAVEFESKKRTSHMVDQVEHIREKSQRDPMTKALNRNGIINEINALKNESGLKMFSIALLDIDNFKTINDTKGHIAGDECLKYLSYSFMVKNRKTDFLGRYGGDEFIFVMPHVNAPSAMDICERMRIEIMQHSSPKFTISIGIATYPYDGRNFTELLAVADEGLYKSKEKGRNCVSYEGRVPFALKNSQS
jgi:diguanylate cyclase (GGDEF)-like protein